MVLWEEGQQECWWTGCSWYVVTSWVISDYAAWKEIVVEVDGHEDTSMGSTIVSIEVDGLIANVNCVVIEHLI